jgi:hypothetical protein
MTTQKIREAIAESGKMSIKDVVNYFNKRYPSADMATVKQEAKEMISEARQYNRLSRG